LADLELVVACWCFSLVVLGGNLLVGGDQWFPWLGRDNLLAAVVYSAGTAWENVKFLGWRLEPPSNHNNKNKL
jgi:hypothetical protein